MPLGYSHQLVRRRLHQLSISYTHLNRPYERLCEGCYRQACWSRAIHSSSLITPLAVPRKNLKLWIYMLKIFSRQVWTPLYLLALDGRSSSAVDCCDPVSQPSNCCCSKGEIAALLCCCCASGLLSHPATSREGFRG